MTDLELLSNRLQRVENRFRWLVRGAIFGSAMLVAGIVMAQLGPQELNQIDPLRTIRRPDQSALAKTPVEAEVRASSGAGMGPR